MFTEYEKFTDIMRSSEYWDFYRGFLKTTDPFSFLRDSPEAPKQILQSLTSRNFDEIDWDNVPYKLILAFAMTRCDAMYHTLMTIAHLINEHVDRTGFYLDVDFLEGRMTLRTTEKKQKEEDNATSH